MITFLFVLAAIVFVLYMVRYARRYGAGQTRDDSESTQYGWDNGSDSDSSSHH